jgi:hypothetical protein
MRKVSLHAFKSRNSLLVNISFDMRALKLSSLCLARVSVDSYRVKKCEIQRNRRSQGLWRCASMASNEYHGRRPLAAT